MRHIRLRRPSRRATIITGVLAVIIALGAYGWLSFDAWKGYERRLTAEKQSYERLKGEALGGKTMGARMTALRTLDDKLNGRSELCTMQPAYAWQANIVPVLKDGVAECRAAVKKLDALAGPLGELRDYLDVGIKIRNSLASLAPGTSLNESNWAELGLKRAQSVQAEIRRIDGKGDAGKLQHQAETLTDSLVSNWQALIKANAAKDKAGFISASAAVAKAYADFGSLADASDTLIVEKVNAVTSAYED